MTDIINLALAAEQTGQRLDKALAVQLAAQNYSRTRLQQLIAAGAVLVNGVAITDTSLLVQGGRRLKLRRHLLSPLCHRRRLCRWLLSMKIKIY